MSLTLTRYIMPSDIPENTAAYLITKPKKPLVVREAPYTRPGSGEIIVKNHAIAINPVDWFKQYVGDFLLTWMKCPFVLGSDVAGEVVEVGQGVTRFRTGDRVLAQAVGTAEGRARSSEGAFQQYTVIRDNLAAPIPTSLSYEEACVLPLTLSTAAVGLFQKDFLALKYPTMDPKPSGETLLVWAGSTSVGSNVIQLAKAAGYEVITTASSKNFEYVKRLGASQVFDYRSPTVVQDLVLALKAKKLAGAYAISNNGAESCMSVLEQSQGRKFIANASVPWPDDFPEGRGQTLRVILLILSVGWWLLSIGLKSKIKGIQVKFLVGDTLQDNEVSKVVYEDFLPRALAEGKYFAAPEPLVVGHGLEHVQTGLDVQKKGVSAKKVVVTL